MAQIAQNLISILISIMILWGGQYGVKQVGYWIQKAALTKAAQGLPPLTPFARELSHECCD